MPQHQEAIDLLISLCQLDIDAWRAYEQAIENVTHSDVAAQLRAFQADHDRHIRELGDAILRLGGNPPDRKPDIKGFLIEGFTAIRSQTGTAGALKAMDSNEMLTNNRYEAALDNPVLPPQTRTLVAANYADEQRHLEWIRDAIAREVWRTSTGPSAQP